MSQVFYHCATEIHNNVQQSHHLQSPFARGKIRALDTRIMSQVFYQSATGTHNRIQHFFPYSVSMCQGQVLSPRLYDFELSVPPLCYRDHVQCCCHFLSCSARGVIQALDPRIMSQVFYYCATEIHNNVQQSLPFGFSLCQGRDSSP